VLVGSRVASRRGGGSSTTLSRTLRARDNGAADTTRCLRGAKRCTTTRIKPTSGGKACGFTAFRGLSAAPLGNKNKEDKMNQDEINKSEWENKNNWSGGIFGLYFSKKDTRIWVPKSIPALGWTVNVGHPAGAKWLFLLLLLPFFITLILLLFILLLFIK